MVLLQNIKWQEEGSLPPLFSIPFIYFFPNSFGKHSPSRLLKAFLASYAASVNTGSWYNLQ